MRAYAGQAQAKGAKWRAGATSGAMVLRLAARPQEKRNLPMVNASSAAKKTSSLKPSRPVDLEFGKASQCPVDQLRLDLNNPRLQTGDDRDARTETEVIEHLAEIAALDELVLSICTNGYLNLEPLIVHGEPGRYVVLEGNRRLSAIRLINDPELARECGVQVPPKIPAHVLDGIKTVLVYRVREFKDAREFIGFKHINGPQRWDAYAKAKFVTDWYRAANGALTVDDIAAKMGDNNNTLRSYIYAILILDQAEESGVWSMGDRGLSRGRFPFSHLYTAIQREQYQEVLGLTAGWSSSPPIKPIKKAKLPELGEVLTYIYGSKSDDRPSLIKSQNPDLKNLGLALVNPKARVTLRQRGTIEEALDDIKNPTLAFRDALVAAKLRLDRAMTLMVGYSPGDKIVDELIEDIYELADTIKTMTDKKRTKKA